MLLLYKIEFLTEFSFVNTWCYLLCDYCDN